MKPESVRRKPGRWSMATLGGTAAAVAAGLAGGGPAEAVIVYTNPDPDIVVNNDSFPLDVNSDGLVDFTINHTAIDFINLVSASLTFPATNGVIGTVSQATDKPIISALPADATIDAAQSFLEDQGFFDSDHWADVNAFAGLRFAAGDGSHFGWAHFAIAPDDLTVTLRDYAYCSTPDEGIAAGATSGACLGAVTPSVPFPASLLLLAAGAVGIGAVRRAQRRTEAGG